MAGSVAGRSSLGNKPFSRHQAPFCASLIDALISTASNRATAVQPPLFLPDAKASDLHRSNVSADTPTVAATTFTSALSGGSNLATARSLNPCPYRATSSSFRPSQWFSKPGDNYSDAGGVWARR